MVSEARSPRGHQLAEQALVRLGISVPSHLRDELNIIGGLSPEFLTADPPVAHQGTNDVDVLLSLGVAYDREDQDFRWLERALLDAGFYLDPADRSGWQWYIELDTKVVKLELLSDAAPEESGVLVALPECEDATAMNLHGPRAALTDFVVRELDVPDDLWGGRVSLRFAGLAGYLVAKASAIVRRRVRRDAYDFAFVLLYNTEGGARAAAEALLARVDATMLARHRLDLKAAAAHFTDGDRPGAMTYAGQMRDAGDDRDFDELVEDAAGAVAEFWGVLDGRIG